MNAIMQNWDAARANYPQQRKDYEAKLADWKKNLPPGQASEQARPVQADEPFNPFEHHYNPTLIYNEW